MFEGTGFCVANPELRDHHVSELEKRGQQGTSTHQSPSSRNGALPEDKECDLKKKLEEQALQ